MLYDFEQNLFSVIQVNAFDMVIIETWALQTQYNALCHVLGSGMNVHLQVI